MIKPTQNTITEYRETYSTILENNHRILNLIKRYPIYIILAGKSYKFASTKELKLFLSNLQKVIEEYGKLG